MKLKNLAYLLILLSIFSCEDKSLNSISKSETRNSYDNENFTHLIKSHKVIDLASMPRKKDLQRICKAISVLTAIFEAEYKFTAPYYSYDSKWGANEEFFEMNDGQGSQIMILFLKDGCVINGLVKYYIPNLRKKDITKGIPKIYEEFIFGKTVSSCGTNFCMWTNPDGSWQAGINGIDDDSIQEYLTIFDGNPRTYRDWALEGYLFYYGNEKQYLKGIPLKTVTQIYQGKVLTKKMVLLLDEKFTKWKKLEEELKTIGYNYDFN